MLGIACRILALESQQLKGFQLSKTVQKIVQFKQITHVSGGDYLHQVCEATKQDCEVLFKRTLDNK
jgi:hypothetical protein